MAGNYYFLHDDIVRNILARLPAKSLQRFMCVSTHWNRMLKEPNFTKLRSLKVIILPLHDAFRLIHHTRNNIVVKRRYPIKKVAQTPMMRPGVIGTFDGIVLLTYLGCGFVLYNPFTRALKKLPSAPARWGAGAYGFGYGANSYDLKIVRFKQCYKVCDVYDFKLGSWSSWRPSISIFIATENRVGTFANGFLYWIASYSRNKLLVLDVKDMVLSEMNPPFEKILFHLGTVNGRLCALHCHDNIYDMWVMKEHDHWSKTRSFEALLGGTIYSSLRILDSGRILMVGQRPSLNLIIYDPSLDSYTTVDITLTPDDGIWGMDVLEYVESQVSTLDMYYARRIQ